MKTNQPIISEDKVEKELQKKHAGIISEFFWICAGANRKILRQCPTDYAKYAGIGGTILFTAIMAMFSGGYALYFVFNSQKLCIHYPRIFYPVRVYVIITIIYQRHLR